MALDLGMRVVQLATLGVLLWYGYAIKKVIDHRTERFQELEKKLRLLEQKIDRLLPPPA